MFIAFHQRLQQALLFPELRDFFLNLLMRNRIFAASSISFFCSRKLRRSGLGSRRIRRRWVGNRNFDGIPLLRRGRSFHTRRNFESLKKKSRPYLSVKEPFGTKLYYKNIYYGYIIFIYKLTLETRFNSFRISLILMSIMTSSTTCWSGWIVVSIPLNLKLTGAFLFKAISYPLYMRLLNSCLQGGTSSLH